jgi:lysozyme family protein
MIDRVLEREGGFVDHPFDKGGPTNKGITLETLKDYLGHAPTLAELRDLTTETARDIYFQKYMEAPGFGEISSDAIRELLFDAGVNSGPKNAVKMLQRTLNKMLSVPLDVDGVMGKKTIEAMQGQLIAKMVNGLLAQRLRFYADICRVNPRQTAFAAGWMNRVAGLLEGL